MPSFSLLGLAALSLIGSALGAPLEVSTLDTRQTACSSVHVLIARGSNEAQGDGILGTLASKIMQANSGATKESIVWPAVLSPYGPSVKNGTAAVTKQLTAYVNRCPNTKIVMLGYSQGAQIIGDSLCGGDAAQTGAVTAPISSSISSHVAAAVWYGDPRYVAGKSFDKGTATTSGIYARPASQSCDKFASQLASYCDAGDPVCAKGNQVNVHLTYPSRWDTAAAAFVSSKVA